MYAESRNRPYLHILPYICHSGMVLDNFTALTLQVFLIFFQKNNKLSERLGFRIPIH